MNKLGGIMNFLSLKNRSFFAQSVFFAAQILLTTSLCADVAFTAPLTHIAALGHDKDVFLVKDAHNKQFILKYNTKNDYISPSTEPSIHEALGAKIGLAANININDVTIFPAYDISLQSVDTYPHIAKTLHTVVPGKEVWHCAMPYNIDIFSALTSQTNLHSLTFHKDLCKIAALDIFTSNIDRHNGNLSFDSTKNQFHAFDMDWSFRDIYFIPNNDNISYIPKNITAWAQLILTPPCTFLATKVYNFLKEIEHTQLSDQEIEVLKEINATLKKLQTAYPPAKLYAEWMNIAHQANYTYSIQKQQCIRYLIAYNHLEITKIRAQINRIISDKSYKSKIQRLKDKTSIIWQDWSRQLIALHMTFKNYKYSTT
jgi:hypothetical protein